MTSGISSYVRLLSSSGPRASRSRWRRSSLRRAPDRAALERQAEINKLPDTPGTGRFPAMKEEVPSLPRHVVYRPKDLGGLGGLKLGVVAWGNGGCSDDGASSRFHLLELASHGYLVMASGRILSGPGAPPPAPRPAPTPGQTRRRARRCRI